MRTAGSGHLVEPVAADVKHRGARQLTATSAAISVEFTMLVDDPKKKVVEPSTLLLRAGETPMLPRSLGQEHADVCYPPDSEMIPEDNLSTDSQGRDNDHRPQIEPADKDGSEASASATRIQLVGAMTEIDPLLLSVQPLPLPQPSNSATAGATEPRANAPDKDRRMVANNQLRSPVSNPPILERVASDRKSISNRHTVTLGQVPIEHPELSKVPPAVGGVSKSLAGGELISCKLAVRAPTTARDSIQFAALPSGQARTMNDSALNEDQPQSGRDGSSALNQSEPEASRGSLGSRTVEGVLVAGAAPTLLSAGPVFHQIVRTLAEAVAPARTSIVSRSVIPQSLADAREILIELRPEGLGRIVATLTRVSGELRVRLRPESEPVAQQLQSDIGNLGRALAAAGVAVSEISIAPASSINPAAIGSPMQDAAAGLGARGQETPTQRHGDRKEERAKAHREMTPDASPVELGPLAKRSYLV